MPAAPLGYEIESIMVNYPASVRVAVVSALVFFLSILMFWAYPVALKLTGRYQLIAFISVQNLTFCEEGLSDSGQLGFIAQLEDPASPNGFRMAVFRATPAAAVE